jgi:iron complex outermembrane recepter protein
MANRIHARLLGCSVIALLSTSARIYSAESPAPQAAPAPTTAAAGKSDVGEIVVTANKREQKINDVGQTIQAATGDVLAERGITSPGDLSKLVPGFTATQSTFATPVFVLRGIGLYDAAFGSTPAVAVYTDQIPRNYPLMSEALDLDVERVEVLKGPQGTLFGQSATGGAINYITGKPTDSLKAGADFSYERFGKVDASGYVSGPLADTLTARLAVRVIQGGAWQYSYSRPDDVNGATRKLQGRLSLDWKPSEQMHVQISATGARDHSDVQAPQPTGTAFNIYSTAALAAANANPATRNPFGVVNNAAYASFTTPGSPNFDGTFLSRQATVVSRLNGTNAALAAGARAILGTPDLSTIHEARIADWTQGFLRPSKNSYYQGTLRADYEVNDQLTLTSITAYAKSNQDYHVDLDGTASESLGIPVFGNLKAFNQEIRVAGKTDRLNWMVGANYDDSSTVNNNFYILKDFSANNPVPGFANIDLTLNNFNSKLKTIAGFANGEYKIMDNLTLTAGIRYTENRNTGTYCYNDPAVDTPQATNRIFSLFQNLFTGKSNPPITAGQCFPLGDGKSGTTFGLPSLTASVRKLKENNWSFRGGLDYKMEAGGLLYVSISQGYKTGIFSNIGASSQSQYTPATQEKVVAYEGGFKMPLADNRIQFNGAAFYYDYSDKQIRAKVLDPIFGLLEKLVNVPKSYIWGLEGEFTAQPADGLTFAASGTYLNSKVNRTFRQTPDGTNVYNQEGYTGDFKGSKLPYTSKFSGNADIGYKWAMNDSIEPFVGGTIIYQGRQSATFVNTVLKGDRFNIPGYTTVDLRAGIGSPDNKWKLTFYGRNVFDKYYISSPTYYQDDYFSLTARPATYGVALKWRL